MKITHLIFSLNTGGIEHMLVDIVNEQSRHHDVALLIVNNSVDASLLSDIAPTVTVGQLGRRPGSLSPIPLLHLNWLVGRRRSDVIHCHNHPLARMLVPWRRPLICLTVHDVTTPTTNFWRYDKVFAISDAVREDIARKGGRAEVVRNGIATGRLRARTRTLDSPFRIVQVGRLAHDVKGQDIAIKAIAIASRDHPGQRLHLDFIGAGASLPYLQELVRSEGLSDSVSFLGNKDRAYIYENLGNYDLLLQPSRCEGFGLTVAEAMAAKVPVLVSNCEGTMEVIDHGRYGAWFISGSASDLATRLRSIIDNYSRRASVVASAYEHCQRRYSVSATAHAYMNHYQAMHG